MGIFYPKMRGFSLTEILILLGILITVTIPMVMMLSIQQKNIEETQLNAQEQVMLNALFDNVQPLSSNPITFYTQTGVIGSVLDPVNTTVVNQTSTYRLSVYCDPASKSRTTVVSSGTENTLDRMQPKFCTDRLKPPYFERYVVASPDNSHLTVTIKLFRNQLKTGSGGLDDSGDQNNGLYFQAERSYELDRLAVKTGTHSKHFSSTNPNFRASLFASLPAYTAVPPEAGTYPPSSYAIPNLLEYESASEDNMYPEWYIGAGTANSGPSFYTVAETGCENYMQNNSTIHQPSIDGKVYQYISDSYCSSAINYGFKVTPGMKYDIQINFFINHSQTSSSLDGMRAAPIQKKCFDGLDASGVTCMLADIDIFADNLPYGTASKSTASKVILKSIRKYDTAAPLHLGVAPAGSIQANQNRILAPYNMQVEVPSTTNTLYVRLKPSAKNAAASAQTVYFLLDSVIVTRRNDL